MSLFRGQPQVIILIALSMIAAAANFYALFKGPHVLAQLNGSRGGLAAGYAVAYTILLFNINNRANWSIFMSDVAYISWPVVWIIPPIFTYRKWRTVYTSQQAGKYEDHV